MQLKNIAVLALASVVCAEHTVTLKSIDDSTDRTIVWTGTSEIADTSVPAGETVNVTVPTGWIGNFYAYNTSGTRTTGMLAEFAFDSYAGQTYFDVSAIVNPEDKTGVYQIYPSEDESPISGCQSFACANAYYEANDVQTKASDNANFVVTLGGGPMEIESTVKARDAEVYPREAVLDPNFVPSSIKGRFSSALRWANRIQA